MSEIADATKAAHSEELQEAEERAAVASIHARINGEKEARKKQQLSLEVQTRKIWESQAGPALPGSVAAEEEVGEGSKLRPHEVAGAIEGEIARLEGEKRRRAEERVQERVRSPALLQGASSLHLNKAPPGLKSGCLYKPSCIS